MAEVSTIEWTDSTFNPWIGCTKVSPGCDHCYAERDMAIRRKRVQWGPGQARSSTSAAYWKHPLRWNAARFVECPACSWRGSAADFKTDLSPQACPRCSGSAWTEARRRVFCASLSDWLDKEAPIKWLADLLSLVAATPNLDWLLLTKRISNWRSRLEAVVSFVDDGHAENGDAGQLARQWLRGNPPGNVLLGLTICNQHEAYRDLRRLLSTPAWKRFLSIEPMLSAMNLRFMFESDTRVDWIICGGESGAHARPMHPDWARSLRDQCAAAGVPFLFKQWGCWLPISELDDDGCNALYRSRVKAKPHENQDAIDDCYGRICTVVNGIVHHDGSLHSIAEPMSFLQGTGAMQTFNVGKHAAGRLLDGVEHNGAPA